MRRKYPKTTGHYNYVHILPNKMCYFGESSQQPSKRWQPSAYKTTALGPYIEEIGWDNIEHIVIQDGLTKHQAEVIEDWFIKNATKDGFCLNDRRSGGKSRDNIREYKREYEQLPERKEYRREYRQRPEVKERKREYNREYRQRPEVKEYYKKYNQTEKRKEYQREYHKTEKYKEYQRQYRLKKKALKN